MVAQHRLEQVLVHCERRCRHTGADVGDVRELEEALHAAVLAERAVQDREDDLGVPELRECSRRRAATSRRGRSRSSSPRGPARATPTRRSLRSRARPGARSSARPSARRRASRRRRGRSSSSSSSWWSSVVVGVVVVVVVVVTSWPTLIVTAVPCFALVLARWILGQHDAVLARVGHRLHHDRDREAACLQGLRGVVLLVPGHVRHRGGAGPARHRHRHRRSLRDARADLGIGGDDLALGLVGRRVLAYDVEPRALELRSGRWHTASRRRSESRPGLGPARRSGAPFVFVNTCSPAAGLWPTTTPIGAVGE